MRATTNLAFGSEIVICMLSSNGSRWYSGDESFLGRPWKMPQFLAASGIGVKSPQPELPEIEIMGRET
jgi:hypothetical protein